MEKSDHASLVIKQKVGVAALQFSPKKGRADKRRINYTERTSNASTMDKNMHECMALDEHQIGL